jgi:hypothetical protein
MTECPKMREHFNQRNCRSSHNRSDREENVQQIYHWNVIRVVLHVSSFLFTVAESLNSSVERVFSLRYVRCSRRQITILSHCQRPMTGQVLPVHGERVLLPKQDMQLR